MKRPICRALLPVLAALALTGGCAWNDGPVFGDGKTFYEKYGWTESRMLRHGWLERRYIAPSPIYCYRTISSPDCYKTPQPGQERRLIASFTGNPNPNPN